MNGEVAKKMKPKKPGDYPGHTTVTPLISQVEERNQKIQTSNVATVQPFTAELRGITTKSKKQKD
ncbi:MAG: hypothetical protein O8C61_01715 [Candidatus Methanoperedens sp.]|nr:hypothetical protein [Candidatus Methanoperedens sp.]